MKTFAIAFILGIFVGALVTTYFSSPDAYQQLEEAKSELLGETPVDAPALAEEEPIPTDPAQLATPTETPAADPAPDSATLPQPETAPSTELPLPEPEALPDSPAPEPTAPSEATPEESTPAEATPVEVPLPADPQPEPPPAETETESPAPVETTPPETFSEKAKQSIDKGAEKATELLEEAKVAAKDLAENAEPYLEQGVDLAIRTTIRAQFKLERAIDSDDLSISVKDRKVHLTGKLSSNATKQLAIEIALGTKGVTEVTEAIEVASE